MFKFFFFFLEILCLLTHVTFFMLTMLIAVRWSPSKSIESCVDCFVSDDGKILKFLYLCLTNNNYDSKSKRSSEPTTSSLLGPTFNWPCVKHSFIQRRQAGSQAFVQYIVQIQETKLSLSLILLHTVNTIQN